MADAASCATEQDPSTEVEAPTVKLRYVAKDDKKLKLPSSKPLQLSIEEAEIVAQDEEALVLLSRGIVYTGPDAHPSMMANFQRAVASVPEKLLNKAATKPGVHTLVVDYAAVFGLDCPSIDTLILYDDLGQHLSFDDLQQFLGRLRRNGRVVFTSYKTLADAALGNGAEVLQSWEDEYSAFIKETFFTAAGDLITPPADLTPLMKKLINASHLTGAEPKLLSRMFLMLVDELLSGPDAMTRPWSILAPWLGLFQTAKKPGSADDDDDDDSVLMNAAEQQAVIELLYRLMRTPSWAAHPENCKKLFAFLVNKNVLDGAELVLWWRNKEAADRAGGELDVGVAQLVVDLDDESDDEEEEEEDDDEEEEEDDGEDGDDAAAEEQQDAADD